jgi:hypothetical protein
MISPIDITAPVQQLINRIGSAYEHEIISVIPEPTAKPENCYINVGDKVARDGGALVYGWAVWLGDFICEGEHHAVWEDDNGNLIDITPHRTDVNKLLFIPDDRFSYEGKYISNIRVGIADNPLIDHFILLSEMKDYLMQFATRIDEEKINFNTYTGNMYNHYNTLHGNVELYLRDGGKFGSPCYCKSLKPYSKCHGKHLLSAIEVDKKNIEKING